MIFDAGFFQAVLPERVAQQCPDDSTDVPVVKLHLSNGQVLDICQIMHLADRWLATAYFRNAERHDETDVAFLPYELVTMVTVSVHRPETRRVGFIPSPRTEATMIGAR